MTRALSTLLLLWRLPLGAAIGMHPTWSPPRCLTQPSVSGTRPDRPLLTRPRAGGAEEGTVGTERELASSSAVVEVATPLGLLLATGPGCGAAATRCLTPSGGGASANPPPLCSPMLGGSPFPSIQCGQLLGPAPSLVEGVLCGCWYTCPPGGPSPLVEWDVSRGEVATCPTDLTSTIAESSGGAAAPPGGPNAASPQPASAGRAC
jgi:hypothetical protein